MKKKLPPYRTIHRTTIAEVADEETSSVGVYVIAYMGRVMYVGKTVNGVTKRLCEHLYQHNEFGNWLFAVMDDWQNVRIDIIEPMDHTDKRWLRRAEIACIKQFSPVFNQHHNKNYSESEVADSLYYRNHNPIKQLDLPMSVP